MSGCSLHAMHGPVSSGAPLGAALLGGRVLVRMPCVHHLKSEIGQTTINTTPQTIGYTILAPLSNLGTG